MAKLATMSESDTHLLDPAPFGRVIPAMVTVMTPTGGIDYAGSAKLAQQLVADGADGILVNGTTGESPTTHTEEKADLVRAVKEAVNVPVISGSGSNDTAHTVRMSEYMQEAGADGLLVVAPYYSRPSQEGIVAHYAQVDQSTDIPVIVYDVPGRTGVKIGLDAYEKIAQLNHVVAVKDATGDLAGAIKKRAATGLTWYSGDDGIFLPFLSVGAVGIISVIAHVASNPMQQLIAAFDSGDLRTARSIAAQLSPLVDALNGDGFQAVMAKAALQVKGYLPDTTMRLPNIGPGALEIHKAQEGLRRAKLLG